MPWLIRAGLLIAGQQQVFETDTVPSRSHCLATFRSSLRRSSVGFSCGRPVPENRLVTARCWPGT